MGGLSSDVLTGIWGRRAIASSLMEEGLFRTELKCSTQRSRILTLSRGVRQGCPVSSLLFVLCMEVLANSVRRNVDIKGLSLDENGTQHAIIVQYADDTTLFLRNTHEMRLAINMLEHFGRVAGTVKS